MARAHSEVGQEDLAASRASLSSSGERREARGEISSVSLRKCSARVAKQDSSRR